MNLKEVINVDFKEAFKSGDAFAKSVIIMLKSAIKNKEIDNKGEELTDEQIIDLVSSEVKKRKDSIKQYEEGGRNDLADSEKKEIDILMKYMPEQLSEDDIKKIVDDAVSETGSESIKDLGKVMSAIKDKVKGKADGSLVAGIVREKLS